MQQPVYDPSWPEEVKAVYRHDLEEIWDSSAAPHVWNQYHNQLDLYLKVASDVKPVDILDVGCAQGTLALILAEKGYNVTAVDLRQSFLKYARSRHTHGDIRFVTANVFEWEPDGGFDLIFSNQLIEHLVHPVSFVKRLAAWLRPGGALVVTTPNGDYLRNDLPGYSELGDPAQYEHKQFTADGDGHFFAYHANELESIFNKAMLRDVSVSYFETPWISGHMKVRLIHRWAPRWILQKLDRMTLYLPGVGSLFAHQMMIIGTREK